MLNGIGRNANKLARRGIDKGFIDELTSLQGAVQSLDDEQESLKARLKEKTSELDNTMATLNQRLSEVKKLVKLDIPKESWKEFGITDVK